MSRNVIDERERRRIVDMIRHSELTYRQIAARFGRSEDRIKEIARDEHIQRGRREKTI